MVGEVQRTAELLALLLIFDAGGLPAGVWAPFMDLAAACTRALALADEDELPPVVVSWLAGFDGPVR